jgi:hypothetical protein
VSRSHEADLTSLRKRLWILCRSAGTMSVLTVNTDTWARSGG